MNVAILHYHLNRGGVTQVIWNHLHALASSGADDTVERVAILYGGRKKDWPHEGLEHAPFQIELAPLPELEYDDAPTANPDRLSAALLRELRKVGFSAERTLLHAHNHALGKNASLPGALARLAREGFRLLLQVHDFAEDFRPDNYQHLAAALRREECGDRTAELFPQADSIHYAALNRRDRQILQTAGIPAKRLHWLPNPVAGFPSLPQREAVQLRVKRSLGAVEDRPLVVYPVRGIRRKNIGETLLLSALDPRRTTYAITLAPINPIEAASFYGWCQCAEAVGLPCRFDTGGAGGVPYTDMLKAADALLTTSVAEGFGMVFLESWLAGQLLVGRNLWEITADFTAAGIRYPQMYDRLNVPLALVGEAAFRDDLIATYEAVCRAYARSPEPRQLLNRRIDELIDAETVDFARLGTRLQQKTVAAAAQPSQGETLREANPSLRAIFCADPRNFASEVLDNAELVRQHYSLEAAGERLSRVYRAVLAAPAMGDVKVLSRGALILESFLDIRRLHPVRLETCPPLRKSSDA